MTIRSVSGFSLIELMVAVAIVAILALAAAPLGSAWVANSRIDNTANILAEGYATARALALENKANVSGVQAASAISVAGGIVSVSYLDAVTATTTTVWQKPIDTTVNVSPESNSACAALVVNFTNLGMPANGTCFNVSISSLGGTDLVLAF
jgi:prepilin-type N-terminal cleavage/methylation domain-containing protein